MSCIPCPTESKWHLRINYFFRKSSSSALMKDGEGNGIPLQYSCLENPTDGGAWWAAVYGATQSRTRQKRLSGRRAEESEKLSLTLSPFLSEQFGLERVILTSQRLRFPICKLELLPPRLNQGRQCKELSFAKVYANAGGFT